METDNKRKLAMIISLIFVALALVANLYALINLCATTKLGITEKSGLIFDDSFAIIALISAIIYVSAGFKKTSAKFFKFFLYAFILSQLITLFSQVIILKRSIFAIISTLIPFILLNVLFGTKDLGKKTSIILSTIILACVFAATIFPTIVFKFDIMRLIGWITDLSLSAVLLVMMILKYYDKALRKGQPEQESQTSN